MPLTRYLQQSHTYILTDWSSPGKNSKGIRTDSNRFRPPSKF